MTFIKNTEDFTCENCGDKITGNGYTNHCPACLYSKHVDVDPGDRKSDCGGIMTPVEIELEGKEYSIVHQCDVCGYSKKNKISPQDDFDKILDIAKNRVEGEMGTI